MTRILLALASLTVLSGCEMGASNPNFGDATHNNVAVQSVQPLPPPAAQPVAANGTLAARAQDRYEKDNVKQPASVTTSDVGVGGSSGGGSGGGSGQ